MRIVVAETFFKAERFIAEEQYDAVILELPEDAYCYVLVTSQKLVDLIKSTLKWQQGLAHFCDAMTFIVALETNTVIKKLKSLQPTNN